MKRYTARSATFFLTAVIVSLSTGLPGRLSAAPEAPNGKDSDTAPTLEEQPHNPPAPLRRAVRLQGNGGAGGIYYPSAQTAQPADLNPAEAERAYQDALELLYRDFRRKNSAALAWNGAVLNDLALLATTLDDWESAEVLLRLALTKEDSLPLRLNLAFLAFKAGDPRGRAMMTEMRLKMSDPRRESVVRELIARGFPEEAAAFVEGWLKESATDTGPNLLSAARLIGYHHLLSGKNDEALSLFRRLDDRSMGRDAGVLFGLARSLASRPADALAAYRRLMALPEPAFKPERGPSDEMLRAHAELCIRFHAVNEAERSLAALRHPAYGDVRLRLMVLLQMNPRANVEPIMQNLSRMSLTDLRPGAFPPPLSGRGFQAMLEAGWEAALPVVLVTQMRMDVFGSADPAQIEKDRRSIHRLY